MRAIQIDEYLETIEEHRAGTKAPAAGDWGRLVDEGRSARVDADAGRWRIGQLASLVQKRYRSGALQRYAVDIGESYSSVRRYRWVVTRYDHDARFRFPSLSFSHFQAVASLRDRLVWLDRAQRNGWSVDQLMRTSHGADRGAEAPLDRARATIEGLHRSLAHLSGLVAEAISAPERRVLAGMLSDVAAEIERLQKALGSSRGRPAVHSTVAARRARVAR